MYFADIAAVSVNQARDRYNSPGKNMQPQYDAYFEAIDCFSKSLSEALPDRILQSPFDVVSMQFCMHYAFENIQKTRIMLENVTRWLRPGGIFIGTIPNDKFLLFVFNFLMHSL